MNIGRLLAGLRGAIKPGMSTEQEALRSALSSVGWDAGYSAGAIPSPIATRAVAAEAAFRPYVEPHDRRQFFRNALGLPHRARQIEATIAEPEVAYREGVQTRDYEDGGFGAVDPLDPEDAASYDAFQVSIATEPFLPTLERGRSGLDQPLSAMLPHDQASALQESMLQKVLSADPAPPAEEPSPVADVIQALMQRFSR